MGGGNGDGGVTGEVLEGGKGNGCRGAGQPIGPLARPGVGASAGAGGAGGVSIAGFVCEGSKRSRTESGCGAVGAVGPLPGLPVITPGGGGAGGGWNGGLVGTTGDDLEVDGARPGAVGKPGAPGDDLSMNAGVGA